MSTTAIFILIGIVAMGVILWLVIYSGKRGEKHREKTSIKPRESHGGGRAT